jgi:hypothetical protein
MIRMTTKCSVAFFGAATCNEGFELVNKIAVLAACYLKG